MRELTLSALYLRLTLSARTLNFFSMNWSNGRDYIANNKACE